MTEGYILLLVILAMGLVAGNALISGAAIVLLLMKTGDLEPLFPMVTKYGFSLGLFFMIITILAPLADERITLSRFTGELFSRTGLITVAVSAVSALMAKQGVGFLNERPELLVGLLVGGVFGVIFLGGVPTGPLIPAGLAALVIYLLP